MSVGASSVQLPLLERESELAELDRAVAEVAAGGSAALLIEGAPGIGKTALMDALRERAAAAGLLALSARGTILEHELEWTVVRQLLSGAVGELPAGGREAVLSGAAALATPVLGIDGRATEVLDPSSALYGLYWLTVNLSEKRPLLVAVDDLQWVDRRSLSYLAYLLARLQGVPILLATAVRTGEPDDAPAEIDALRTADEGVRLRPTALSATAGEELGRQLIGRAPGQRLAGAVHAAAGGNPFLLHELWREIDQASALDEARALHLISTSTPDGVVHSMSRRLARFAPPARRISEAVAALSASARVHRVRTLAGVDAEEAAEALARLFDAEILRAREHTLEFVHPLLRQAVYERLPLPRRDVLHARAAELLHSEGAPAADVAAQLLRAAPAAEPWRIDTLREAAAHARRTGAPEACTRYLLRALIEPPIGKRRRYELLMELGQSELQHDPRAATEHLRAALELAPSPSERARTALPLAQGHALLTDFRAALAVLDEAVGVLGGEHDELRRTLDSMRLAFARWDYGSQPLRRQLFAALRDRARTTGDDELLLHESGNLAHELAALGEDRETTERHARRTLEAAPALRATEAATVLQLVTVLVVCDVGDEAERVILEALGAAQSRGAVVDASIALNLGAYGALRRGDIPEAITRAQASLELSSGVWSIGALAWLIEALAEHGEADAVERILAERGLEQGLRTPDDDAPLGYQYAALLHHRGRARALASDHERALEDQLRVGELSEAWGVSNPAVTPWRSSAARSLLALGRTEEAAELARDELALARRWGTASTVGVALRVSGECQPDCGALELLRESVSVLADAPARLEHARALVALGARLRRERQNLEARGALRQALDLAHRCGGLVVAERARDELVAAGGRPRRDATHGVDALTGRERRIAELVVSGLTNRQVAEALFVSPRTVEHHLRNVYRKLGVSSRDVLASALSNGHVGAIAAPEARNASKRS